MRRIAKLTPFKVSMLDFHVAKAMFSGYIFNRKDNTGHYLMADKEQQDQMKQVGIKLTEVITKK